MGQHFTLKFLKRRILGDVEVMENKKRAVHAKDHSGNVRGARTQGFSKNECRSLWLQFDGMNLFAVPSPGKCRLSSRRAEVAHPIHDPIRGYQVAVLILNKNGDRGHDGLATFPSPNREQ